MQKNKNEYYRTFYDEQSTYWSSVYKNETEKLTIYAKNFRQRKNIILGMANKLAQNDGKKALDAGCGPGAYIHAFLAMGYDVCAIDQSPGMIEKAKENIPDNSKERVTLKVSGIESIPFPDDNFDLVTNVAVLMYVPDDKKSVNELYRVAKPGGTLIITVDNKKDFPDLIDIPMRLKGLIRRIRGRNKSDVQRPSGEHKQEVQPRCYSPKEMRNLLISAGFVIDEQTSIGFTPILFNHRRIFTDRVDLFLDKILQFFRYIPVLKLTGYTYICRCHKP
jgi:SAM-dependent methyltransferase